MRATRVILFASSLQCVPFFLQTCNELIDRCISCQFSTDLDDLRRRSEHHRDSIYLIDSADATQEQIFDLAALMHRSHARAALFLNRGAETRLPPGLISQQFVMLPADTSPQDIVDFIFDLDLPWISAPVMSGRRTRKIAVPGPLIERRVMHAP